MSAAAVASLRVRYAETDQMGIAWHGNYFAWFEVGRTDLLRGRGQTYRELESRGLRLPVIEAEARFVRPALYDDVLEIHTRVAILTGARIGFAYEVRRAGEAACLATGRTLHAVVAANGRPTRIPAEITNALQLETAT